MDTKPPPTGFQARFRQHFRARIISGFLFLLPIGITVLIVRFLYTFTAGLIVPLLNRYLGKLTEPLIVVISIASAAATIYFLGVITTHVLGKRLIRFGEAIILRLPLLKSIYGASKQVVATFSASNRDTFKSVVMVEFPRRGLWSIGFTTGMIEDGMGNRSVKVFLPTTPNPTTGFFLIVPIADVVQTDIAIEDALKIVISGGILTPPEAIPLLAPPAKNKSANSHFCGSDIPVAIQVGEDRGRNAPPTEKQ
jgi:uncharacterized membrane protein